MSRIVLKTAFTYYYTTPYYRMAYNLHTLGKLRRVTELSLVKTLANKYKTSCQKIYRRYSTTITIKEGTYKVLQVTVKRDSKKPLEAHFGAVPLRWNKWVALDDDESHSRIWSKRSEVIDRLLAEECELCGSKDGSTSPQNAGGLPRMPS